MTRRVAIAVAIAALVVLVVSVRVPLPESAPLAAARLARTRLVARDVAYRQVGEWTGRLDVYRPARSEPAPAILFMHGGGWVTGSKDTAAFWAGPFLLEGSVVVAISYRLADVALAPAAVEDVRCAVRWVAAHAAHYGIDPRRIVTAGDSAGAHLALMAGLLRESDGFDGSCAEPPAPPVCAIVNLYGISDVSDLMTPVNGRAPIPDDWAFASLWVGDAADRDRRARHVSPISWVRPGAPPVFTAHGTADELVPYHQATILRTALDRAGVANQLVTVEGRGHGDFSALDWIDIVRKLRTFLARHVPKPLGD